MKERIIQILKLSIAFGIIAVLVRSGKLDFGEVMHAASKLEWILPTIFLIVLCTFLASLRWWFILRTLGLHANVLYLFKLTWIGLFFNNILLGSIGGDATKIIYLMQKFPQKKSVATASIILDRASGLFSLLLITSIFLILNYSSLPENAVFTSLQTFIFALTAGLIIAAAFSFTKTMQKLFPFKGALLETYQAYLNFQHNIKNCVMILSLSLTVHIAIVFTYFCLLAALTNDFASIAVQKLAMVVPLGTITMTIPLTPSGVGVGQAAFAKLFEWTEIASATMGANMVTLYHVLAISLSLIGAIPYVLNKKNNK